MSHHRLRKQENYRDEYLEGIQIHGHIRIKEPVDASGRLFGEVVEEWAKITAGELKSSTFRDYRDSMNHYILPRFGNMPIGDINYLDIRKFVSELPSSAKRKNNILVPMRSVFKIGLSLRHR